MEPNITKFIEIVKASGLEQADKDTLVAGLSDPATSIDQKQTMLSTFFKDKLTMIDTETLASIKPILDQARKEMDDAEAIYNKEMEFLNGKVIQAEQVIGDALDKVAE
jgi:hypothetical protein